MSEHCVALLGRRDRPTDAVEEYCTYLSDALRPHNFELELARVNWENGWSASLSELRQKASAWRGQWVLLQYTALAWSKRGFPVNLLRVVRLLRQASARVAVVYHDVDAYKGSRLIDKLRRSAQLSTMRRAMLASQLAVLTVPAEQLSWLPRNEHRMIFIPVGANLRIDVAQMKNRRSASLPSIAVFGITGGAAGERETEIIIEAIRLTSKKAGRLNLQVFGRHAELRERRLREALRDFPVQLEIRGVISAAEVVCKLSSSDVLLFVRGPISSRRGSAIAGIACGVPVVAYAGPETAPPITEAGIVLVSTPNAQELAAALTRVLLDRPHHDALAAKSQDAYQKHFSWSAIAERYADALRQR